MNSIHNNGENDQSLNDGLDKLGHAYGQLEQDEPPELLDLAILNSAHRAVEKKPHWMKFGWLHGLTTAAVFVLAFSIVMDQREPVPVFENGMRNNEPVRLQREKTAKKQSADQFISEDSRMEMKVKSESRQDMRQSMPTSPAAESVARETAPAEMAEQAVLEVQSSLFVSDSLQGKTDSVDKDALEKGYMLEEELIDEVDLMADIPQAGVVPGPPEPAIVAEPTAVEMKARGRTAPEIEQILQAIIKLKQSGDESWKTELELFKQNYPGYPLPDELKD